MEVETILNELEKLGTERTKKMYMQQGAQEPVFGTATGAMKPFLKGNKHNQVLAEALYATGNYDAMYLAGMLADPKAMREEDFDRWMESAYFFMISDYIVSVTLSETDIAQTVSDKWIASGKELYVSAGYSCYCWLLGNRKDEEFDKEKLLKMLQTVKETIYDQPERAKYAMSNFVSVVGVSYAPLHNEAFAIAKELDNKVEVKKGKFLNPSLMIQKAIERGQIGFKRRYVRC